MNPRDVLKYELIGIEAEVIAAKNKALIGIKGKITDETRNTITLGKKKILKEQVIIKMKIKKGWFYIEIEITPQEISDMYEHVHPDTQIFTPFIRFLVRIFNKI